MTDRDARLATIAVVGALVVVVGSILPFVGALPTNATVTPLTQAIAALADLLWLVVAGLVATRQAGRFWILLLGLVVANEVWALGYTGIPAVFFLSAALAPLNTAIYAHVLLAFPDGRLRRRYDIWFVRLAYAVVALNAAAGLFLLEPGYVGLRNPFVVVAANDLATTVQLVAGLAVPLVGLGLLLGVWRHWRDATPAARRGLRPLVFAVPIFYGISSIGYVADNLGWQDLSGLVRTPAFIATGVILPLGYLLATLRARWGRARLADLATALGRGIPPGGLRDVLARAVGDPTLQLAFAGPGDVLLDADGRPAALGHDAGASAAERATTPVERAGRLLAVLVHDPAIDAEDPGLVAAVGSMAALALENERLAAEVRAQLDEVRASRARLAEAADGERRKIERDLHDGAQQRLVALTMRLEQARASGGADAVRLIDQTTAELREAIAEVRQLARGMPPPILAEAGLAAAVESLAERTPLPVTVQIDERRFPPSVEAAAYYLVAEALTNIGRHAGATEAAVSGTVAGGELVVSVRDDGRGGADAARGSGLRGLADRVSVVGGTLAVESADGAGTTVSARFPVR